MNKEWEPDSRPNPSPRSNSSPKHAYMWHAVARNQQPQQQQQQQSNPTHSRDNFHQLCIL